MSRLSSYEFEPLREDADLVLSRGSNASKSILILTHGSAAPAPSTLAGLSHAFRLRDRLDSSWATRPRELIVEHGRTTLILEDPGGTPLVSEAQDVATTIRIAIGIAVALKGLHESGLVHKDIKPANLLVDVRTGRVWLTGFGITSELPRERRAPEAPDA